MTYNTLKNQQNNAFTHRHVGLNKNAIDKMLAVCDVVSLDALVEKTVPAHICMNADMNLPDAVSEHDFINHLRDLAGKNTLTKDLIGQGYYNTLTPAVIQRNILENPGWYTAYTPYQPEISQGRLEAILNFQTMIADLTGLDIANASLLDEGTAAAEAMTLCNRQSKSKSNAFFVANNMHPQTTAIIQARGIPLGYDIIIDAPENAVNYDVFGAVFNYPATDGSITDYTDIIKILHEKQAIIAVATDLLALTMIKSPAEMGADIAFGSSQRFGVPMGFGGPHAAFFACHDSFKRNMAGRLVGVSIDSSGKPAYRLTLQTREQHIRREKATSNICTAQVLLAVIASMYACYHGASGLKNIAVRTHLLARIFGYGIKNNTNFALQTDHFFDTVIIHTQDKTSELHQKSVEHGYNLRHFSDDKIGVSFDESCDENTVKSLWKIFGCDADFESLAQKTEICADLPPRETAYLTHKTFNSYHSETQMMRYLRTLMDKDFALDRGMIPLGSCTMKLNAATEMMGVTMAEFANMHPLRPLAQTGGFMAMIENLEDMLAVVTGFDAVSLQPNSGASGEFAGLMAIRGYHHARGDMHRTICLIPSSAHGTNPASAIMAGMQVIVVKCDDDGNIDVNDLQQKAEMHAENLAALMVTYPSTHGVFETAIRDICDVIHRHGGQVYMDGANMNAQVGLTSPALIGADVCHLNLHKTFCIPHGGGGPGVGPIGVKSQLVPFLPGHHHLQNADIRHKRTYYPVSSAPFGSAGILCISYAYICMMGANGLKYATETAILSANYIAKRLSPFYPILYTASNGTVAHECILDTRPLKDITGVSVDDIAKRLADYGFHAPTMSFPVSGTLMIEPTESEDLQEIDRFCDAMIAIYHEADAIIQGVYTHADSPLAHAPHTAEIVTMTDWNRPYSRHTAAYPNPNQMANKYWPAVGRVDNVYGDRNVICSCPDISDYE